MHGRTDSGADSPGKRFLSELSGACGDLGTFLPYAIAAMTVAGLAPLGVLFGSGAFLIASGLFYGVPMAVQPMEAVSAVLLTGEMGPSEAAATGVLIGAAMVILSLTGAIGAIARVIPRSVTAGLQVGLGLTMSILGFQLMTETLWLGPACAGVSSRTDAGTALPFRATWRPGGGLHRLCRRDGHDAK